MTSRAVWGRFAAPFPQLLQEEECGLKMVQNSVPRAPGKAERISGYHEIKSSQNKLPVLESELATERLTGGDEGFGVCHLLNYQGDNYLKRPFSSSLEKNR